MERWDDAKCLTAVSRLMEHLDKLEEWDVIDLQKLSNVEPPLFSLIQENKIRKLWEKYAEGEPQ